MIKISHSTTSDSPHGQPWPPSDSNALWFIVRRAGGYMLWRAIQLAQVETAATDFCNSPIGSN
jgi:hypothetical protein